MLVEGCNLLAARVAPDGSALWVIGKGTEGIVAVRCPLQYRSGEVRLTEGERWPLIMEDGSAFPSLPAQAQVLEFSGATAFLLADTGGTTEIFVSNDGLRTWRR